MKLTAGLRKFLLEPPSDSGLVYDLPSMVEQARSAKKTLGHNLNIAIKALPHTHALKSILPHIDGADVSNINEYRLLGEASKRTDFSVWLTRCPLEDLKTILTENPPCQLWFTVERTEDLPPILEQARRKKLNLALRIRSGDIFGTGHPAHYDSRFGISLEEAKEVMRREPLIRGIHFHHYRQEGNARLFPDIESAVSGIISEFPSLIAVNVGGGWDLSDIKFLQAAASSKLPLVFEPGRSFSENHGHAFGRLISVRKNGKQSFIEGRFSATVGLKWAFPSGFTIFPSGAPTIELSAPVTYGGPTCYEEDKFIISADKSVKAGVGDLLVIHRVSGYSMSWNCSFNGVVTPVYFLGEE